MEDIKLEYFKDMQKRWGGHYVTMVDKKDLDTLINAVSDHKAVVEKMQNKIDELTERNSKLYNCIESTYKHDLPKIDELCDIARVHRFTMLRSELEELLAKGIK